MHGIQAGPHYEILSTELAKWLEDQRTDRWWNVEGDPLLAAKIMFPCPTDKLAPELRKINRPLLVEALEGSHEARGQSIVASQLAPLANDRIFYLCWKGSPHRWVLGEAGCKQPCDEFASRKDFAESIPPEILAWAREGLNEEETLTGLREIRETGGLELADFIQELEHETTPRD